MLTSNHSIFTHHNLIAFVILISMTSLVAIVGIFLVLAKPRLSDGGIKKMYSWTGGFIVVVSIMGLFGGAVKLLWDHFHIDNVTSDINIKNLYTALLLIAGVVLAGGIFYTIDKKFKKPISLKDEASTSKRDSRWKAIIVLIVHRIPEGLATGFIASNWDNQLGLIIVIAIHIIPEKVIIYYRLTQIGKHGWKAYFISLSKQLVSFTFAVIGLALSSYLASDSTNLYWIMPILYAIAGAMMTITIFFELAPEFTGDKFKPINTWYFFMGLALAIIILSFGS